VQIGVLKHDLFKTACDNCTNIDKKDRYGVTPFHKACALGKREHAKMLASKGAQISIRNQEGKTALADDIGSSFFEHYDTFWGFWGSIFSEKKDDQLSKELNAVHLAIQRGRLFYHLHHPSINQSLETVINTPFLQGGTPIDYALRHGEVCEGVIMAFELVK
jgi:hypothetical protein